MGKGQLPGHECGVLAGWGTFTHIQIGLNVSGGKKIPSGQRTVTCCDHHTATMPLYWFTLFGCTLSPKSALSAIQTKMPSRHLSDSIKTQCFRFISSLVARQSGRFEAIISIKGADTSIIKIAKTSYL